MSSAIILLFMALGAFGFVFVRAWIRALHSRRTAHHDRRPGVGELGVGAVTNFFDTLGIGSFAPGWRC